MDAASYQIARLEMREQALNRANAAYPDADAMLKAIAAIPAVERPTRLDDTLELIATDDETIELRRGGKGARVTGGNVASIIWWHRHLAQHGDAWAAVYLSGVAHGLTHAAMAKLEDTIRGLGERRDRA